MGRLPRLLLLATLVLVSCTQFPATTCSTSCPVVACICSPAARLVCICALCLLYYAVLAALVAGHIHRDVCVSTLFLPNQSQVVLVLQAALGAEPDLVTADSKQDAVSQDAAGLKEVVEGEAVPDAMHQQALKQETLRKTGLDQGDATANPDVKNGVRIRALELGGQR